MNRRDTRTRAEQALRLRSAGHSWASISDALGFRSRGGARLAVDRFLKSTAPESDSTSRRTAVESLRVLRTILFDGLFDAKAAGDYAAMGTMADKARLNIAEEARISGLCAPDRVEVNVSGETTVQVLAAFERKLLDAIDAEVVPEIEAWMPWP